MAKTITQGISSKLNESLSEDLRIVNDRGFQMYMSICNIDHNDDVLDVNNADDDCGHED